MTKAGERILRSVAEARKALRAGNLKPAPLEIPSAHYVKDLRYLLDLSQEAFAERFGLSAASVRDWEQGRRKPDPAARVLLAVIAINPVVVDEAVASLKR